MIFLVFRALLVGIGLLVLFLLRISISLTPFCEKVYRTSELVDGEIARAILNDSI